MRAEASEEVGSCFRCKAGLTFLVLPQGLNVRHHPKVLERWSRIYAALQPFTGLDCP